MSINAHCVHQLGLRVPSTEVCPKTVERCLQLGDVADPKFGLTGDIDVLIGADIYHSLLQPGFHRIETFIAQSTVLGWIFFGKMPGCTQSSSLTLCLTTQDTTPTPFWHSELVSLIQRFWEIEAIPHVTRKSPDDEECEAIFSQYQRAVDGKYIIRLPFKHEGPRLIDNNLTLALRSLRALKQRLLRDPEMAVEYGRFMKEYQACGHMRLLTKAELNDSATRVHYIPHHGIWQAGDQKKKLRVVFNASKPTLTGYSLNDVLHTGPKLQTNLPCVLIRWRRHRVAFCTDVRMMYRQIWIDERDVNFQRIVWSPDGIHTPLHFLLLTVTYETSCAPYQALRTLDQLCIDQGHEWPEAVPIVKEQRYADDILSGADDIETARIRRDQVIGLLQSGGFPLRKWVANVPDLLEDLPEDVRLRPTWHQFSSGGLVHELGVNWNPVIDMFQLVPPMIEIQRTKRTILAALARLFDPCGWLAPTILMAKLLMQDIWKERLDWDQMVPNPLVRRWSSFVEQMRNVSNITIPRWIGCLSDSDFQLHVFADASRRAMAAVVYSRVLEQTDCVRTCILMAKTKLTSIKSQQQSSRPSVRMTIPRLELRAALMAAKILVLTAKELGIRIENCYAWSDSKIVLQWLRSNEPTNHSVVDDYISHISELVPSNIWRHVPTESNPADIASRGLELRTLEGRSDWWNGPRWLSESPDR